MIRESYLHITFSSPQRHVNGGYWILKAGLNLGGRGKDFPWAEAGRGVWGGVCREGRQPSLWAQTWVRIGWPGQGASEDKLAGRVSQGLRTGKPLKPSPPKISFFCQVCDLPLYSECDSQGLPWWSSG